MTYYYQADGVGSITSLPDAAGAVVASYVYDSFGNVSAETGSVENPYRYTGREWDAETGLYYYRARYYDPQHGRFLSEDPIGFSAGVNFYSCVSNSPTNVVDPTGLKVRKCCRTTHVNWWVDAFSQLTGAKHCFIKTDTVTAGMGPANNGPLPVCPFMTQTAVTNHSAEPTSSAICEDVPNVDEACVNKQLEIGKSTGRWTPLNQCNSFVSDVFNRCSSPCKPKSRPFFSPDLLLLPPRFHF